MAYKVPIQEPEFKKFDESRCYKDLDVKSKSLTFKNLENIDFELQELSEKEKFARLIYYVKKKEKNIVFKILTESELDLNYSDNKGITPLHYAVYYGEKDITSKLLFKGASNSFVNIYGETAVDAGRKSIEANKSNPRHVKNNHNIEACIKLIENSRGSIKIKLKENENLSQIRTYLNKLEDSNKDTIIPLIIVRSKNLIKDRVLVSELFKIIFDVAEISDLYLGLYVEVIINILDLDKSYDKEKGIVHILMGKTYEYYTRAISEPTLTENRNVIKFITHFYSYKITTKSFLNKIINDLIYVIEQSFNTTTKELEEAECIHLLVIVLTQIKSKCEHSYNSKYEKKLSEITEKYNIKPRLKFLIQDYIEIEV